MKLKFICGLILLALTFSASAQFTSNSISGISPSSAFGTNGPGTISAASGTDIFQIVVSGGGSSVTTNNVYYYGGASGFYTNTLGTNITYLITSNALAALGYPSNKFAAICYPPAGTNLNLLYTNTANNLISTNWVKAATAGTNPAPATAYQTYTSTFFGAHSYVSAGSAFGTNALSWITNGSSFTGAVSLASSRIGIISTNFVTVVSTNSTTNFLAVSGMGTGNYYATNGVYLGTNGFNFSYNPAAGGIWMILNSNTGCNSTKSGSSNPVGGYTDNGCGASTVAQGTGTFTWTASTTNISYTTNYP